MGQHASASHMLTRGPGHGHGPSTFCNTDSPGGYWQSLPFIHCMHSQAHRVERAPLAAFFQRRHSTCTHTCERVLEPSWLGGTFRVQVWEHHWASVRCMWAHFGECLICSSVWVSLSLSLSITLFIHLSVSIYLAISQAPLFWRQPGHRLP